MSVEDLTLQSLVRFLRQSTIEGLLNPAVAKSRINAVEQLQVELTEQEREDIRQIDVDDLCGRFHKLHDSSIRPEVLALYNKRMTGALVDYLAWLENPKSFFSVGGDTIRKDKRYHMSDKEVSFEEKALEEITLATTNSQKDINSVRLREDVTVYIQNLPLDLTQQEAEKIAKVVKALAVEEESVKSGENNSKAKPC